MPLQDTEATEPPVRLGEHELGRLLDVGRSLVSELDLETVLRHVLETARDLTGARYAALGILDEPKKELERFLFVGIGEDMRRTIGPLPRGRGVLGELIRHPEPLRLPDVTQHPRSYGFPPGHPPMATFLGVPIVIRGEAFGNLYLTDKAGGEQFDDADVTSVVVLAEWAAIAIDNARLYEQVERRREELERAVRGLEATAEIARAVGFETDLERVLELIVKRGRALIEARSLFVLVDESGELTVAAAAGEVAPAVVGTVLPPVSMVAFSTLTTGRPERIADLSDHVGHGFEPLAAEARSALVAPLGYRGRGRGVVIAFDRLQNGPQFDADDEHVISSFAASAAIAIATAQSVEAERLRHSMRASDEERKRWARELHDETLQQLGALKMGLETARQTDRPEVLDNAVERALEQIDLSITGLQSLITELRPAALDELGVEPAVEALVERMASITGMAVEARIDLMHGSARPPTPLQIDVATAIYRLVQEALTNAAKHAGAERAWVEIVEEGDTVSIIVRDDGKGFDPGRADSGFGLVGMRERVALVGGRLAIDSAPGRGTAIRAQLPAPSGDLPAAATAASA
jgi:signal transduction histidine kinase